MTWTGHHVNDDEQRSAYTAIETTSKWSDWMPFDTGIREAPRKPGVYLFREPSTHRIVYVGHAGERTGSGRPMGIYQRLSVYRTGKGAVSGFGEAALDRALADPDWVEAQLARLRGGEARRAKLWAAEAIARVSPQICWTTTADKDTARALESQVEALLRPHGLWNR